MVKGELTQIIAKRDLYVATLTRFVEYIKTLDDQVNIFQLRLRVKKIEEVWTEFQSAQDSIEISDKNIDTSHNCIREAFESDYYEFVARAEEILQAHEDDKKSISHKMGNSSSQSPLKLPQLRVPNFAGKFDEWNSFHDLFTSIIHKNTDLDETQKLYYLRSSLHGEALGVIQSLELTANNYEVAWKLLLERYNNVNAIIQQHVKCLLNLPQIDKESPTALRSLLDTSMKHTRALEALKQPVQQWDALLVPIITRRFDHKTLRDWQSEAPTDRIPSLVDVTNFLNHRCLVLESLTTENKASHIKQHMYNQNHIKNNSPHTHLNRQSTSTSTNSFSYNNSVKTCTAVKGVKEASNHNNSNSNHRQFYKPVCPSCKQTHRLYQCPDFIKLSIDERVKKVQAMNACANCLRIGHKTEQCISGNCKLCDSEQAKHNTLLCKASTSGKEQNYTVVHTSTLTSPHKISSPDSNLKSVLLSTALVYLIDKSGNKVTARALLDSGSESSFICEDLCQTLRLPKTKVAIPISGVGQSITHAKAYITANLQSITTPFSTLIELIVLPKITGFIPSTPINLLSIQKPDDISLADPEFYKPSKIDLLIGADLFWILIGSKHINSSNNNIQFRESTLGWIVTGHTCNRTKTTPLISKSQAISCQVSTLERLNIQLQKFWEIEEVEPHISTEDKFCEDNYLSTTSRDISGRYSVEMPLKTDPSRLGDSRALALKRFNLLERRLSLNKSLHKDYSSFIDEYIRLGHMKKLSSEEIETLPDYAYFLPHHPIFKESSSTTKLRVVFDASAKTTSGLSLNDILHAGPILQDDLFSIVTRFRTHNIVMCADIEKMFRQINIQDTNSFLLLILWRNSPHEPLDTYKLTTVTYGTTCAPYLAKRTLQQVAQDETQSYPQASQIVQRDFYMDDLMSGCSTVEEAIRLRQDITALLLKGGFNIRKWKSNSKQLLSSIDPADVDQSSQSNQSLVIFEFEPTFKTLGLMWDPNRDTFQFLISIEDTPSVTKRKVLSIISKIFDPLGLLGPIITKAKIIMQQLWFQSISWDDELPQPLLAKWVQFYQSLIGINNLFIPRQITLKSQTAKLELHCFSDASEVAYGACVYLRSVDSSSNICTALIASKSRVAPLKSISLPRLELCGAVLLVELLLNVQKALNIKIDSTFLWTDSTIVLAWIASTPVRWTTFVRNRVSKIQSNSDKNSWRHVSGKENPADLISRGVDGNEIDTALWWNGPHWLTQNNEFWINPTVIDIDQAEIPEQSSSQSIVNLHTKLPDNVLLKLIEKYSSYSKILHIIAYCFRFISNCKSRSNTINASNIQSRNEITVGELDKASLHLIKAVQEIEFSNELKDLHQHGHVKRGSKLATLAPFIDNFGLIRVGGRLEKSSLSENQKHPIVLPNNHRLSFLIAVNEHIHLLHAGSQTLLSSLRERFWPLNGRNLVRKVVHQCIRCFRVKPRFQSQQMGQLPASRIQPARAFLYTAVDYFGPIMLKPFNRRGIKPSKSYVALFVCFTSKAIHMEIAEDLSSGTFIDAFLRFVHRRGKPAHVYSDNGSNFVGAEKEIKSFFKSDSHQHQISEAAKKEGIRWHFQPPAAPHANGLVERSVGLVKHHLYRVIGKSCFSILQFNTLLAHIESIVNSRPLTPLSNDPSDYKTLTPSHFLIGESLCSLPDPTLPSIHIPRPLLEHWKHVKQVSRHFWSRWSKDYLHELQARAKWHTKQPNIELDTLVLIKEESPPLSWKTGRVVELHPGQDGLVRVVTLRTATGIIKRPITKLCPLPLQAEIPQDS